VPESVYNKRVAAPLFSAVQYMHSEGIVHRCVLWSHLKSCRPPSSSSPYHFVATICWTWLLSSMLDKGTHRAE
jgi:hypothetical protein